MLKYNIPIDCDDYVPKNGDLVAFNDSLNTIAIYNNKHIFFGIQDGKINNHIIYNDEFLSIPSDEQICLFEIIISHSDYRPLS